MILKFVMTPYHVCCSHLWDLCVTMWITNEILPLSLRFSHLHQIYFPFYSTPPQHHIGHVYSMVWRVLRWSIDKSTNQIFACLEYGKFILPFFYLLFHLFFIFFYHNLFFLYSFPTKEDNFVPYRPILPIFSVLVGRPVQKCSDFVSD